jgi:hypothetical protein
MSAHPTTTRSPKHWAWIHNDPFVVALRVLDLPNGRAYQESAVISRGQIPRVRKVSHTVFGPSGAFHGEVGVGQEVMVIPLFGRLHYVGFRVVAIGLPRTRYRVVEARYLRIDTIGRRALGWFQMAEILPIVRRCVEYTVLLN